MHTHRYDVYLPTYVFWHFDKIFFHLITSPRIPIIITWKENALNFVCTTCRELFAQWLWSLYFSTLTSSYRMEFVGRYVRNYQLSALQTSSSRREITSITSFLVSFPFFFFVVKYDCGLNLKVGILFGNCFNFAWRGFLFYRIEFVFRFNFVDDVR